MFDGWCASTGVDPWGLPWSRFLNLVYYFATHNTTKEKKREFDSEINKQVSMWNVKQMAVASKNALSSTENDEQKPVVPKGTSKPALQRRSGLPPTPPAGWGSDEEHTRSSLLVAQSLKVGKGTRANRR